MGRSVGTERAPRAHAAGVIAGDGARGIERLTAVIEFDFSESGITQATVARAAQVKSLRHLSLSGTKCEEAALAALAGHPLESLNLSYSEMGDAALAHVSKLTNLQGLDVSRTLVTDTGLAQLTGLKQLRKVYARETSVTNQGRQTLKKALPGCQVFLKKGP